MATITAPPPVEKFELSLRRHHLQQLRYVDIPDPETRIPGPPWPQLPGDPSPYEQLVQWSKQAQTQIANAISNQVVSPDAVDWNIEVFTLLESAAVYLRDTSKVFQAVIEARKGTDEGDKAALDLLEQSQTDIKKIAAIWGLDFEVICDLLKYSPEGHPFLNGPFCGVFYSKDTSKPFLGLTFKAIDIKFAMMMATGGILWGSPVHTGFYQTMFLNFSDIKLAPLHYIKNMIDDFLQTYDVPEGIEINLHSTGHSLGAAYATLCYAELMRLYNDSPAEPAPEYEDDPHADLALFFSKLDKRQFILRDLYTFGCPRVGGLKDNVSWALRYKTALDNHTGKSWRVVNSQDPVTKVPPIFPFTTWNHVDNGYKVTDSNPPETLPTEVGTQPGVSIPFWRFADHSTAKYFQNLYNASKPGSSITVKLVEEIPDEELWGEIAAEAAALLYS